MRRKKLTNLGSYAMNTSCKILPVQYVLMSINDLLDLSPHMQYCNTARKFACGFGFNGRCFKEVHSFRPLVSLMP